MRVSLYRRKLPEDLFTGEIGSLYGVRFIETFHIPGWRRKGKRSLPKRKQKFKNRKRK